MKSRHQQTKADRKPTPKEAKITREIDARVAREVMGFVDHDNDSAFPTMKTPDGKIVVCPPYSTDMNAAKEVVEKMRGLGWYLTLESPCPGRTLWEAYFTHCDNATKYHDWNADTPAIAICLAALEAVKQ